MHLYCSTSRSCFFSFLCLVSARSVTTPFETVYDWLFIEIQKSERFYQCITIQKTKEGVIMGSVCSKGSYEKMAGKKNKKKGSEKLADLDKTMRDGSLIFSD